MASILFCITLLTGCRNAYIDIQKYSSVDLSEKSITVLKGGSGIHGEIKKCLLANDWKMFIDTGPSVTKGNVGDDTYLEQRTTFHTKYRLELRSSQTETCLDFTPKYNFDISLINNQTGGEVFTVSGKECEADIATKFCNYLNNKSE